jgi:hypothetical protein
MIPAGPREELRALKAYASELEKHFIRRYLTAPTLSPPNREESLQVAAYVVLVHGALENFIEGLALWTLDRTVTNWTAGKATSRRTAAVLLYQPPPKIDSVQHVTTYENIRLALASANQTQSIAIRDNNGIALKHVRELFYPLGVDVPNDPVLTGSIDMIVTMRHQWAHQYRFGTKIVKSAKDAMIAVADCLEFAKQLAAEVSAAR